MGVAGSGTYDSQITNEIINGQQVMARSVPVALASDQSPIPTIAGSVQSVPIVLFDATVNATTPSLSATLFPGTLTITGGLPAVNSGLVATLTSGGNVVGAVFAPASNWASVLLDLVSVGSANKPMTIEVGRFSASGAYAQVLASAVLTSITTGGTIAAGIVNPLTGQVGHASVAWRFFDKTVITAKSQLGDVLQAIGGAQDNTPSQLVINVAETDYVYVIITALDTSFTEIMTAITPAS